MVVVRFPPVELADSDGLLALGGDLEVPTLIEAYSQGIFPWPISKDYPLAWFSPNPRGVLRYENLNIPRSLEKFRKKNKYSFKFNTQFKEVIDKCAELKNRKGQISTWITDDIKKAYTDLFEAGLAYSIEAYDEQSDLVGGLYGVSINGFVSGESMFYEATNASKLCLVYLMEHLHQHGIDWMDTQTLTPVVESLGGEMISRKEFLEMLKISKESSAAIKGLFQES